MANISVVLPDTLIGELGELEENTYKMMDEMTRAGAETAKSAAMTNAGSVFSHSSEIRKCIKITRCYRTPSDDGVNHKVYIGGYFTNRYGQTVPAPLAVMAREYGTSRGEPARPFFFRSFSRAKIKRAMLAAQEKYIPKD